MIKKLLPFVVLLVVLSILVYPLTQPGFFRTDDGDWMVIRLSAFHQTFRTGQFPVRFLERLNHGYGYPVLDFLYPLPFYLGEAVHILGVNFVDTVKVLFGLSFIFGAIFMYLYAGLWPAVFYTLFPYRVTDVYQRGSLGEAVSFVFLPLIFYFLDRKRFIYAAILIAALITSHNSVAFMFLPIIFFYGLTSVSLVRNLMTIILSLLLSAFFWLPALYDLQYTKASIIQVSDFSHYFFSITDPTVIITICLVLLILILVKQSRFFTVITAVSLLFALSISTPIWQYLPLPKLVQFPWRFLSITAFGGAVLVGQLGKVRNKLAIFFVSVIAILGLLNLRPDRTFQTESFYATNDDSTTVKNEYMPVWVKSDPKFYPASPLEIIEGNGKILNPTEVFADTNVRLQINKVYFPGVKAYVDGQNTPIDYSSTGLVTVNLSPGQHTVKTQFTETPVRLLADGLSLLGIAIILLLSFSKTTGALTKLVPGLNK